MRQPWKLCSHRIHVVSCTSLHHCRKIQENSKSYQLPMMSSIKIEAQSWWLHIPKPEVTVNRSHRKSNQSKPPHFSIRRINAQSVLSKSKRAGQQQEPQAWSFVPGLATRKARKTGTTDGDDLLSTSRLPRRLPTKNQPHPNSQLFPKLGASH